MKQNLWKDRLLAAEEANLTEKQLHIIIAAIELFGEKGYAATPTREIAQRAGVSEGTIFKHYATKKELLLNVSYLIIHHFVLPMVNYKLQDLVEQHYEKLEDFLEALLANRLELIQNNILVLKVLLQEALFQPEIKEEIMLKVDITTLYVGLEKLKKQGLIIDLPTEELFKIMLTVFFGYIFSRHILLPELVYDREAERAYFIRFMARGLKPAEE